MTWSYEVRTFSAAGAELARISDFEWMSCVMAVNSPGMIMAGLPGSHAAIAGLEHKSHVELWRRDLSLGIGWYRHFGGLYLAQSWTQPEKASKFTLYAPGYAWLLATRVVNYATEVANRSMFTGAAAETVMKTLVEYNAGASATIANGRKRAGAVSGVTVAADTAAGNVIDWFCHGDILLETLQGVAEIGGGDFDLVKTTGAAWEFRWYTGQLGTDRSATVKFGLELGNMAEPVYEYNRIDEKSVACVWGQGTGLARAYATRTGTDYSATNDVEEYLNASDVSTTDGLEDRGDKHLSEKRARQELQFKVLQTPACQYGLHYYLGDLVTVANPFSGASSTQKVRAVTLGLDATGAETINVELSTP